MPQQVRRRKHTTVNFSANNKVSEDLKRGMVIRHLMLKLAGAATTTGANNTAANTQIGDEWGVIDRIDIVANGTDVIRSISGNALWWYNYWNGRNMPRVTPAIGDGATANPPFASVLLLPFWMPNTLRPIDTALDTRELSSLTIEVTWGQYTDINSAATAWTTEPTLEVYALESFGISGPFSQSRLFPIQQTITASSTQHTMRLPVGPMYTHFLINTTDGGADDGDVINNIKLLSGGTVYVDLREEILEADAELALPGTGRPWSGTAYNDLRQGDDNSIDGWYYLDLITDGFKSEGIDTLGFSELELEFDVTVGAGTTLLNVWPMQVIPIRGATQ